MPGNRAGSGGELLYNFVDAASLAVVIVYVTQGPVGLSIGKSVPSSRSEGKVKHPLTGPLTGGGGGPQCRMSNLRIGNVPCLYLFIIHVDFKIVKYRISNLRNGPCHVAYIFVPCR